MLTLFFEVGADIALESISETILLQPLPSLEIDLIELLGVVFAEVTHKVLVDHLVSDVCRLELLQLKPDGIHVEDPLAGLDN